MSLRQQILSFDDRIKEISSSGSIFYGNGKSNPCAELRYDGRREQVALFLWLPHSVYVSQQNFVARLRIWTDWVLVSDLAHVPKGLGRTITIQEWLDGDLQPTSKVIPKSRWYRERYWEDEVWRTKFINDYRDSIAVAHYKRGIAMTLKGYQKLTERPDLSDRLSAIAQLALDIWLSRL